MYKNYLVNQILFVCHEAYSCVMKLYQKQGVGKLVPPKVIKN